MAKETVPGEKKKRVMGPRVVKDKVVYLTFEGDVNKDSIRVLTDADEVFEAMDANPNLKRVKVVIPAKKKPAAPTA